MMNSITPSKSAKSTPGTPKKNRLNPDGSPKDLGKIMCRLADYMPTIKKVWVNESQNNTSILEHCKKCEWNFHCTKCVRKVRKQPSAHTEDKKINIRLFR